MGGWACGHFAANQAPNRMSTELTQAPVHKKLHGWNGRSTTNTSVATSRKQAQQRSRDAGEAQARGHGQVEGVVGGLVGHNAQVCVQRVPAQVHLQPL